MQNFHSNLHYFGRIQLHVRRLTTSVKECVSSNSDQAVWKNHFVFFLIILSNTITIHINSVIELKEYQTKLKRLEKMLKERADRPTRQNSATIARRRGERARSNNRLGSGRINSGRSNRELSAKSSREGSGSLNSRENSEYNITKQDTIDLDLQVFLDVSWD